ncbi:hypothetical protein WICMUC_005044 [Wickerhamomyces mucosus]|uniref:Uncharacterized protein n=1 Tax=Wickerhamomyces mucosus TaxID=1378264 RepID=A0A9P8PCR9_9ASCO|nr:hypothetical protein WICMUC_005044 [Wickerhamomyces mucosus]
MIVYVEAVTVPSKAAKKTFNNRDVSILKRFLTSRIEKSASSSSLIVGSKGSNSGFGDKSWISSDAKSSNDSAESLLSLDID